MIAERRIGEDDEKSVEGDGRIVLVVRGSDIRGMRRIGRIERFDKRVV